MPSPRIERKLAAIMFTDIVGFTKIMTSSEDTAINILKVQDDIISPLLEEYSGNLLKKMGDGMLVEFSSAVDAVECAMKIQSSIKEYNSTDNDEFHIRIGIHLGDVVMLGDDILGDGVNIASRIEPLASPDGICITEAVHQSIKSKLKVDARRISEVDLKHIDDKYTIYKIPNVEDDNQSVSDINTLDDKIKINNTKRLTGFKYLLTSMYQFKYARYIFLPIFIFIIMEDFYTAQGQNSRFINWLVEQYDIPEYYYMMLVFFKNLILFSLAVIPTFGRVRYRISFSDIRKVIPTLDNIIINDWFNGRYQLINNENNEMTYIGYGWPIIKKISEKFNLKLLQLPLKIKVDGNTLEIEGFLLKTLAIIRSIKKVSQIKKESSRKAN